MKLSKLIKENKQPLNEDCARLITPLENTLEHIEQWKSFIDDAIREAYRNEELSSAVKTGIMKSLRDNHKNAKIAVDKLLKTIKLLAKSEGELK